MQNTSISVVIPCYNESGVLNTLLDEASAISEQYPIEFIFVDNGSTDKSSEILNQNSIKKINALISGPGKIKLVNIKQNKGYGFGIKKGLKAARNQWVGWTHGDGQTSLEDLVVAFKIIENSDEVALIKGVRKSRKRNEQMLSDGMALIASILFFARLHEINAQPTLIKRELLPKYDKFADDLMFDLDFYIFAKRLNPREIRIPVIFHNRVAGQSSWNYGLKQKIKFILLTFSRLIFLRLCILRKPRLNTKHFD